jgi:hypothetical protein
MAKRARGSVRPGQRRPISRRPAAASAAAPAASKPAAPVAPRPTGLTDAEAARAAELEAQLLAEERAAEQSRKRTRERGTAVRDVAPAGTLAVRAETEYAYVARDVKDIVRIATLLFGILIALWLVIDVAGVITIA